MTDQTYKQAYMKKWYNENKEYFKQWREEHKDEVKKYFVEYYIEHKEKLIKYVMEYKKKPWECPHCEYKGVYQNKQYHLKKSKCAKERTEAESPPKKVKKYKFRIVGRADPPVINEP